MPRKKVEPKAFTLYPGRLDKFNRKTMEWAGRFPTGFGDGTVYKPADAAINPNPAIPFGNSVSGGSRDPYSQASKNRFEDSFRADYQVQGCIMTLVKLILGKRHQPVLEPRAQYAADEARQQALQGIVSKPENEKLIADIQKIERDCKFHERLMASQAQKYTFGRSALGIVFKQKLPAELKVLSSKNLGQVYSDPKTWEFQGVDYHDIKVQKKVLPADELLYFTNLDYNITPDTMYYGLSKIEGVAHASETKRIILEEDLKESAKGQWAGIGLIKAAGVVDGGKMEELVNAFDPGKWNATNADVTLEVHKIADKLDALPAVVDSLDKIIIRGIGVPNMISGFEDVQNYATAKETMEVFKATTGEFERSSLQSQLEPQWYESLLMVLLNTDDLESLEMRVCAEFEDIIFETFKDRVEAIKMIEEAGIPLPMEEKLNRLGLEHMADQVEELEEEKQEQEDKMMEEKKMLYQNQFGKQ